MADPKFSRATSDFNRVPSFGSDDGNVETTTTVDGKENNHLVKYNDETYDIYEYLDKHPGGRSILEKYQNKDITRAFDDINHSDFAKAKLKSLKLDKDSKLKIEVSIRGNKIDRAFIMKKLFSKEDKNFIHKTLGLLALCSYVYRYFYVFPVTGNLGFSGTNLDWFTLGLHFMLSFSSLIFHVVERRIVSNPLIIYEEYRLHAIVFTLRGVVITVFGLYQHLFETALQARIALGMLMLVIHLTVDFITRLYGTPGITTVRNDDNGSIPMVKLFFAFYQVLAMSSHVIVDPALNDLGFNTLIAIQSSAFLMTLKRKSLIRARSHFLWYTLALVLSMIYIWVVKGSVYCLGVLFMFYLKVKFNINKYLMWGCFIFIVYYLQANFDTLMTQGGGKHTAEL